MFAQHRANFCLCGFAMLWLGCSTTHHPMAITLHAGSELVCTTRETAQTPVIAPREEPRPVVPVPVTVETTPTTPTPEPPRAIEPSQLVLLSAETRQWEVARVARCEGSRVVLLRSQGRVSSVPATTVRNMTLANETEVTALWGSDGGTPYHARAMGTRPGMVSLRYDDASEEWVNIERILSVRSRTPPGDVAHVCPPRAGEIASVLVEAETPRTFAQIVECGATETLVANVDGERVTVRNASVQRVVLAVGDRVLVRWRDGHDYTARIDRVSGSSLDVTYDDGSTETIVTGQLVAWLTPVEATHRLQPFRCP
jgi:hypothetical protein